VSKTPAGSASGDQKPPRFEAPEQKTLLTFLGYLRESVIKKLDGLDDRQARQAMVGSGTSLLWLIQHLTAAEVMWFQIRFAGLSETVPADALDQALPVADHVNAYRTAAARNDEVVISSRSLDERCADDEYAELTLRWVLVHLVEETARHAGHADIIREQLDGATGR
jgi:uncharacterized damage-inducible protein DinB